MNLDRKNFQQKNIVYEGAHVEGQILTDSIIHWNNKDDDNEQTGKGGSLMIYSDDEETTSNYD